MGQMSAGEVKNIPSSKTRSKYQFFSVLYLLFVLPVGFMSMFSVFLFDAPGSSDNKILVLFASLILLFAPVLLICGIGGLISLRGLVEGKPGIKNRIFLWLPIICFILLFILGGLSGIR